MEQKEGTGGTEEQKMHHEEMPDEIKAVLHDYRDIFPSDLPPDCRRCAKVMNSELTWRTMLH